MADAAQFVWKRGKQAAEHRGETLGIGSRLPCDLVLDDPVAAARHVVLHHTGTGFELEALPTATGTYVGGELVEGRRPLHEGDRLVLGVSRIDVAAIDAISGRIELVLAERSFHFVAKQSREFHSDTDEWVRSEVRFGRMPRLRVANAVAAVLGVVLLLVALNAGAGERALSPGALSDAHAWVLSRDAVVPVAAAGLGADLVASARDQACAACHGEDGGIEQQRCLACHPELGLDGSRDSEGALASRARHPFEVGERTHCADCHREHGSALRPPPPHAGETVDCSACHDEHLSAADAQSAALARLGAAPRGATRARVVTPGFEAFHHGEHAALDCARCHGSDPDDRSGLSFELCVSCHGPGGEATAVLTDLAWHGSAGGHCAACHERPFEAALAQVEVASRAEASFRMPAVPHDDLLHLRAGDRACADCHLTGTVEAGAASAPFGHGDHLSTLAPRTDDERAQVLAECRACHVDVLGAERLVAAPASYDGPGLDACVECHGTGEPIERVAGESTAALRLTPAFDHAAHADVAGGCLACHDPAGASNGAANGSAPHAFASSATCRDCHLPARAGGLAHHHVAGAENGCSACHAAPAGERLAAVFYAPLPAAPPSALAGFSHATPGHSAAACSECHGQPGPDTSEVHVPSSLGASCTECHLATRFHWR